MTRFQHPMRLLLSPPLIRLEERRHPLRQLTHLAPPLQMELIPLVPRQVMRPLEEIPLVRPLQAMVEIHLTCS
jgi:hypothetical protein